MHTHTHTRTHTFPQCRHALLSTIHRFYLSHPTIVALCRLLSFFCNSTSVLTCVRTLSIAHPTRALLLQYNRCPCSGKQAWPSFGVGPSRGRAAANRAPWAARTADRPMYHRRSSRGVAGVVRPPRTRQTSLMKSHELWVPQQGLQVAAQLELRPSRSPSTRLTSLVVVVMMMMSRHRPHCRQ